MDIKPGPIQQQIIEFLTQVKQLRETQASQGLIVCHACQFEYKQDELHRVPLDPANQVDEIGFYCPQCQAWTRCNVISPELEERRSLLQKFAAKASKSDKDFQRFRRKKAEFAQAWTALQEQYRVTQAG